MKSGFKARLMSARQLGAEPAPFNLITFNFIDFLTLPPHYRNVGLKDLFGRLRIKESLRMQVNGASWTVEVLCLFQLGLVLIE